MSEQFTPTSFQVREDYAHLRYHFADGWSIGEERVQFDRWLDQVKAEAWDHAIEHVSQLEAGVGFMEHYKPHNPYRKQEEA